MRQSQQLVGRREPEISQMYFYRIECCSSCCKSNGGRLVEATDPGNHQLYFQEKLPRVKGHKKTSNVRIHRSLLKL